MKRSVLADQLISLQLESETYVHSVDNIREITPYTVTTPVPGSPRYAEGLLNVRGKEGKW